MRLVHLANLLLVLAVAAPALAQPSPAGAPSQGVKPDRQCFFSRQIDNWSEVDDTIVVVRVGVTRHYRLDLLSPCPELRQTMSLGLVSHRGGDSICTGDTFDLVVTDLSGQGSRRCNVGSMQPINREDAGILTRRRH